MHKNNWKQVENQFFKNRDGSVLQRGKKQGVVTQQSHIQLHDTIPISLSVISMGYGPSARLPISIINPRRACAARVTVVGSVCVCPLPSICLRERAIVL